MKIVIVIEGGCLQSVFAEDEIEYELIDLDNLEDTMNSDQRDEAVDKATIGLNEY